MQFPVSAQHALLEQLARRPNDVVSGCTGGLAFDINFAIPNHRDKIAKHYNTQTGGDLSKFVQNIGLSLPFMHFGVEVDFKNQVELDLHDEAMNLVPEFKSLIDQFGAVILRNAYLPAAKRTIGHRNRFPHLNFHIDRSRNQPTRFSLFTRDPFDEEQSQPRESSTLFIPNVVAVLQWMKETGKFPESPINLRTHYEIFSKENVAELVGTILLEHAWNAPAGIGEISALDNQTTFHASYYRTDQARAYRIGVRYVQ